MTIVYEFTIAAVCPVDATADTYAATLCTTTQIDVEAINSAAAHYADKAVYQEHLTEQLYRSLGVTGELTTVGWHSGVKVTVTVGGS